MGWQELAPANGLDYQMLKPAELNNVEKLGILILSDTNGAAVLYIYIYIYTE